MDILPADSRVYVAGHRGVVGSAITRALEARGHTSILTTTHDELDLFDEDAVEAFFSATKPEIVIIAAARVGGIAANVAAPVDFLIDNLRIQNNLMMACLHHDVHKTVFLGSSCIYPREAPQPMSESAFMHGPLEPTNESYAIAKIAGIRLAAALHSQYGMTIICPMPCNVYGRGDHFEFERSHVVSALVRRLIEARDSNAPSVTLWGTGAARRELLFTDDLADACLFLLERVDTPDIINVGSGVDHSIKELAELIAEVVGYRGGLEWDKSKPDGMPRKLMDVTRLHGLGWHHKVDFAEGIRIVVADFAARYPQGVPANA